MKRVNGLRICGLLASLLFACAAYARMPQGYIEGLQEAHAGHYRAAIVALTSSYSMEHNSLTAYALTVCYEHTNDYSGAYRFGSLALRDAPPLAKAYVEDDIKILEWSIEMLTVRQGSITFSVAAKEVSVRDGRVHDIKGDADLHRAIEEEREVRLRTLLKPLGKVVDARAVKAQIAMGRPRKPAAPLPLGGQ